MKNTDWSKTIDNAQPAERPQADPTPPAKFRVADIFRRANCGLLLDVVVFLANLLVMRLLVKVFMDVVRQANAGDFLAQLVLLLGCVGLFVLPPVGATLKRWHYHQRLKMEGKEPKDKIFLGGCLFNPIFYFCLTALIYSAINAGLTGFFYPHGEPPGSVFVPSMLFGIVLMVLNTYLVYRYFSPPAHDPKSEFLLDPRSETIGDICIFVNMLMFQLIWNLVATIPFDRVSSVLDFAGRLFFLSFVALLIYFPPRIFYLADDIKRPRTWLIILLANSPVIIRVMLGTSPDTNW